MERDREGVTVWWLWYLDIGLKQSKQIGEDVEPLEDIMLELCFDLKVHHRFTVKLGGAY